MSTLIGCISERTGTAFKLLGRAPNRVPLPSMERRRRRMMRLLQAGAYTDHPGLNPVDAAGDALRQDATLWSRDGAGDFEAAQHRQ
jgi:hypothetical protein